MGEETSRSQQEGDMIFCFRKKTELWRFLWLEHLKMAKDFHNFPADGDDRNMNFHPNRSLYPDKKILEKIQAFCEIIETHFRS